MKTKDKTELEAKKELFFMLQKDRVFKRRLDHTILSVVFRRINKENDTDLLTSVIDQLTNTKGYKKMLEEIKEHKKNKDIYSFVGEALVTKWKINESGSGNDLNETSSKGSNSKIEKLQDYLGPKVNYTSDMLPLKQPERWLMEYLDILKKKQYGGSSKNKMISKIKCFFGFHEWQKYMGPSNLGNGKFAQRYKCMRCGRIDKRIS